MGIIKNKLLNRKCFPPAISDSSITLPSTTSPTPPSRSSTPERPSSWMSMPRLRPSTPTPTTLSPLDTTSSPPGPSTRRASFLVTESTPQKRMSKLNMKHQTLTPSIGLPPALSPQSRTREAADHAGHSPPLVPWRDVNSSRPELLPPFPNRNSLTATISDPRDATVVPWLEPSSGTSLTRPKLKLTTSTPPRLAPATLPTTLDSSTPPDSSKSLLTPHPLSWPPSRLDQPQLPSKLTRLLSRPTSPASSTPRLTEPRTARTTTSSRTPGTPPGVTTDTSRLPTTVMAPVSAVSRWLLSAQLAEHPKNCI